MKLLISKSLGLGCLLLGYFLLFSGTVLAIQPPIRGRMVNSLGVPFPNRLVEWKDCIGANQAVCSSQRRYAFTDANGVFNFSSWSDVAVRITETTTLLPLPERGWVTAPGNYASTGNPSHFGCGENDQRFRVIFNPIIPNPPCVTLLDRTLIQVENGPAIIDLGDLTCAFASLPDPTNLQQSCISSGVVRLTWNSVAGADNYYIFVDDDAFDVTLYNGGGPGVSVDSCIYPDTTQNGSCFRVIAPNTSIELNTPSNPSSYSWQVRAYNASRTSSSNQVSGPNFQCAAAPLGNPSSLDFNCNWGGNLGRLTWTAGANAAYYSLRFDNLSNGWNNSCSSPNPGDFCADTAGPVTFYDFSGINPDATYQVWVHSRDAGGAFGSGIVMSPNLRCAPDCRIINSDGTDRADFTALPNASLNFSSRFSSNDGDLAGSMYVGDNIGNTPSGINPALPLQLGGNTTQADRNFTWQAPSTPGVYKVRCRAWNDSRVECHAPGTTGIGGAIRACTSSNSEVLVTVSAPPTPTPTPTNTPTSTPTRTPTPTPLLNAACSSVSASPVSPFNATVNPFLNVNMSVNDSTAACTLRFADTLADLNSILTSTQVDADFVSLGSGGIYSCSLQGRLSTSGYLNRNAWFRARVSGLTGDFNCITGMFCGDNAAPSSPIPTMSRDVSNRFIVVSWNSISDSGCAGLGASPYWPQLSTDPGFGSVWPGTWFNSWQAATSQTSTVACTPGQTYYARVRSRDVVDNQSAWSSTVQTNCPACPAVAPTVTFTCSQVGNSQLFNTTVGWDIQPSCVLPHQFNARVSPDDTFPAGNTDETGFQNAPPYSFTSTNNGFGYPAGNDIYAQVQVRDSVPTTVSSVPLLRRMGCANLGQGDCSCGPVPTSTPAPVVGGLRYCPEPPSL